MSLVAYRTVATVAARDRARDRAIASLRFAPTPTTERRLASRRLVFRGHEGGFQLSAQHSLEGDGALMVPLSQPLSLLFAFDSDDPGFLGRYTSAETAAGPNFFLTNRSASGAPQPGPSLSREDKVGPKDMGRIVPRRHHARIRVTAGRPPVRVEVRPHFGGAMIGDPLPIEAAVGAEAADVTVSLEDNPGLAFVLRPKPSGVAQLIVADDELAQMRPLGALELVLKAFPGPPPAEGRAFTALFER